MNNPVEAGIEMARRAIEFDSAHAYPEALQYYRRATALLNQALQTERNEQMRSTLSAKLHEYSARVSYIEANLPRGPTSPQQSHPALNQQQQQQIGGGGGGGLTFPPIPGEDPFTVLSGGSPSAGRPAAPSSSSSSASFGSPHQPHHQQQQQYQQPQQQQQYQPQQYQPQYQQQPQFQQTPAPGSGGFSAAPYGAPPSTKLPAHQLIKMPAQVYIGEKAELQKALDFSEVAKKADKSECYRASLSYYEAALEAYLSVLKKESNPQIKTSLRETIAVYMERAEKIKEFLLKSPDYQDPSPIPPPSSSTSSSSSSSSVTSSSFAPVSGGMPPYSQPQFAPAPGGMQPYGGGGGGYPQQQQQPAGSPWDMYGMQGMQGMPAQHQQVQQLQQQQQQQQYRSPGSPTSFEDDRFRQQQQPIVTLTDSFDDEFAFVDPFNPKTNRLERADTASSLLEKPVILKVKLENSVIYPGQEVPLLVDLDNCSNRVVKFIKVSLIMRDTTYEGGRRSGKRHSVKTKVHQDEFYQGSRFPLSPYSKYEGRLVFKIPESIKPSETSLTGAYCREYEIVVKGVVQLHTNPRVHLPITVNT